MKLVRNVIRDGLEAYRRGVPLEDCPEESDDPLHEEVIHNGENLGMKRVGINWLQIWEIGWQLGAMLNRQKLEVA